VPGTGLQEKIWMGLPAILQLLPQYRDYVWGGDRLRPGIVPTAEAWVVYEQDQVASGPLAGRSLAELAETYGAALLGERAVSMTGTRFPLLIKLLDCASWLSLQVHPDDTLAERLEGPGFFGKTEAWHVLEAVGEAQLIAGIKPGPPPQTLKASIQDGSILEHVQFLPVRTGDTVFMAPGTIHALGPGLLIYEVQQTSDLTYRVYDWDRPQTPQRPLHIEKSLAAANPSAVAKAEPQPEINAAGSNPLVSCRYFRLELLASDGPALKPDTHGESFHALTVIEGACRVSAGDTSLELKKFETALVPASTGGYRIESKGSLRVLNATVG
jgi:mannose-6-phosphate isomerase